MNYKQACKIATGILIVPIGIVASKLWPWWTKQDMSIKILSGIVVLPFIFVSAILSNWWGDY